MLDKPCYKIVGKETFAVVQIKGGIEYDLLESRKEAEVILDILNEGKGPEWDKIEQEVLRRIERKS